MAELRTQTELTSKMIMRKKMLLLSAVLLVTLVSISQGQETKKGRLVVDLGNMPVIKQAWDSLELLDACLGKPGEKGKLGIDLSTMFVSKHMWNGFDLLDDHGAFIALGTVYFGDTGFSGKIIGVLPLACGFEKSVELNYAAFYEHAFLKDTPYLTNFTANYFYYGKPNTAGSKADTQEFGMGFSWPKLVSAGANSVVPSYYFGTLWPSRSGSNLSVSGCEGFIHTFGLGYDFVKSDFWSGGKEQIFSFFGNITYNDGFGGAAVDHDWSHSLIGVSTCLGRGNLTIAPALYYQISMDDSVNNEDELWCGISVTYRF